MSEEQIRRLEITVNDPERMRLGDGLARFEDVADRLLDGERAALIEHLREIGPLEVFHHHVRRAVVRADVEYACDVLAVNLHRGACFAGESLHDLGVRRDLGQQELERDLLIELLVGGGDDDPHPPFAEDAIDPVLPGHDVAGLPGIVRCVARHAVDVSQACPWADPR